MSEYTPTTDEIREHVVSTFVERPSVDAAGAAFDRWVADVRNALDGADR